MEALRPCNMLLLDLGGHRLGCIGDFRWSLLQLVIKTVVQIMVQCTKLMSQVEPVI